MLSKLHPIKLRSPISFCFLLIFFCNHTVFASNAIISQRDDAQKIFTNYKDRIYQIRVIEKKSNKKSSIGSGFVISGTGHIATNFHVVSAIVHSPENYYLEYLDQSSNKGPLTLLSVDVIHDLAIVKADLPTQDKLNFSKSNMDVGKKLFSMGNPHDLGLTIVEATYNGLLERSRYNKILLSGSLNPGMSGGPTLDRSGKVVGINVSTAGNQISFLVPVKYLEKLYKELETPENGNNDIDFHQQIESQLIIDQALFFTHMLNLNWEKDTLGDYELPGKINQQIKCWGESATDEDRIVDKSISQCSTEDSIFVSRNFTTGGLKYVFKQISNRNLSKLHFYQIYSQYFTNQITANRVSKRFVSNYSCQSDFLKIAKQSWKTTLCARRYKKYASLYDISFNMAEVSHDDKGMVFQLSIAGITQEMSDKLIKRFIEEIKWRKS